MRVSYALHQVEVAGEEFDVEKEGDEYVLTHPRWSLLGMGRTLVEAEIDLIKGAREISPHYVGKSLSSLSRDAFMMRDFLLRVI